MVSVEPALYLVLDSPCELDLARCLTFFTIENQLVVFMGSCP